MALSGEPCINLFPDPLTWVRPVSGVYNGTGVPLEDGRVFHAWSADGELRFGFAQSVQNYITQNNTVSPTPAGVVFTEPFFRFGMSKVGERIYIVAWRITDTYTWSRIYYTDDIGDTWTQIVLHDVTTSDVIISGSQVHSGSVFKTESGTLLAMLGYGRVLSGSIRNNGGIWRSTDNGASWTRVLWYGAWAVGGSYTEGHPCGVIQDAPEDGGRIYFKYTGNVLYERVLSSNDDGLTWGLLYEQGIATYASYHTPSVRLANGMAYMLIGRWTNKEMRVAAGETYASFMDLGTDYNMRYTDDSGLSPVHHYWVQAGRYVYATESGLVTSIAYCLEDMGIEPPLRMRQRDDQSEKWGIPRVQGRGGVAQGYAKQGSEEKRIDWANTYW